MAQYQWDDLNPSKSCTGDPSYLTRSPKYEIIWKLLVILSSVGIELMAVTLYMLITHFRNSSTHSWIIWYFIPHKQHIELNYTIVREYTNICMNVYTYLCIIVPYHMYEFTICMNLTYVWIYHRYIWIYHTLKISCIYYNSYL